ncbi:MAG: glycerol kinase, partial [Acidimicrobiaceae bacterium]|nr:glycerol kinase [Acidimicrobiaceae bacterium]
MILVIDVGTTGLRSAIVDETGGVDHVEYRPFAPASPLPGMVEFDATAMATLVVDAAHATLDAAGSPRITGVGIASQRASTVLWDRASGEPLAPAIGWQDLRTVGECLTAKAEHGLALAPNQSATKLQWLLANAAADRRPDELCFGTVDSWVAWTLSQGSVHVTDHSNAGVSGLYSLEQAGWNERVCSLLGIDPVLLPALVDSSGVFGEATALPGSPPMAALIGDQQGSLVGQGCVEPGMAKVTFGTGGMLDLCTGPDRPAVAERSPNGTFPIIAWTTPGTATYGVEAIMLSAGTN